MKILITGAEGQLGRSMADQLQSRPDIQMLAFNRHQLDITSAPAVAKTLSQEQPDMVINTAAYTQVDRAELETKQAHRVNSAGSANLANSCAQTNIPLIHFSTDYVFDGKNACYKESDRPSPIGVYGASKLAGERAIEEMCSQYLILRCSWLFSAYGNNFVKTMLNLGRTKDQLHVVEDQTGKPTSCAEIARVTLQIINNISQQWGLYHLAQPQTTSWFEFANSIFAEAQKQQMGLRVRRVNPIPSSAYTTAAKRPQNSALDCEKLCSTFGITLRPWQASLAHTIRVLNHA